MCAELLGLLGAHLITRECVALGVLALQTVGDLLPPKVRKREGGGRDWMLCGHKMLNMTKMNDLGGFHRVPEI